VVAAHFSPPNALSHSRIGALPGHVLVLPVCIYILNSLARAPPLFSGPADCTAYLCCTRYACRTACTGHRTLAAHLSVTGRVRFACARTKRTLYAHHIFHNTLHRLTLVARTYLYRTPRALARFAYAVQNYRAVTFQRISLGRAYALRTFVAPQTSWFAHCGLLNTHVPSVYLMRSGIASVTSCACAFCRAPPRAPRRTHFSFHLFTRTWYLPRYSFLLTHNASLFLHALLSFTVTRTGHLCRITGCFRCTV